MEAIAIYYESTIIYWNSIVIVCGIIAGFFIGFALYSKKSQYNFPCFIYLTVATIMSVFFAKIMHWYTHIEQYDSFKSAVSNLSGPGYLIPGVLIALWLSAVLLSPILKHKSRFTILDPFAPAFAFIIAIIKFSDIFSDTCLGKVIITNPMLCRLPFAKAVVDSAGNEEYRFATFFITFLLMLIVTVMLVTFFINNSAANFKEGISRRGHVFKMFLVLYGGVEVVMDSTRYDASHLYFPGEALASLNKGAGFMGLSQFFGAVFLIFIFGYYIYLSIKANGKIKLHILNWLLFIFGLIFAAGSEYLVQRFSGMYIACYALQSVGVIMMVMNIFILYRTCLLKYRNQEK